MEQLSIINAPIKHIISSLDGLRVERGRVQAVRRVCCLHEVRLGSCPRLRVSQGIFSSWDVFIHCPRSTFHFQSKHPL